MSLNEITSGGPLSAMGSSGRTGSPEKMSCMAGASIARSSSAAWARPSTSGELVDWLVAH